MKKNEFHLNEEQQHLLFRDLLNAYRKARLNKRNTTEQLQFEINQEQYLFQLYQSIMGKYYLPKPSYRFIITYPVKREIFASKFSDRVIHHLYFDYVSPIFERKFIYDSYACRKGKGTLFGVKRLEHFICSCSGNYNRNCYVMKMDIQGYFMSIYRPLLNQIVRQGIEKFPFIKDFTPLKFHKRIALWLTDIFTLRDPMQGCIQKGDSSNWNNLPPAKCLSCSPKDTGLPIGDLTSQLFSNIYLNEFDQFIKRTLKVRYYGRYVDDFFIVEDDINRLRSYIEPIQNFLKERLLLTLHPNKTRIYKVYDAQTKQGETITFLGTRIHPFYKIAPKRVVKGFRYLAKLPFEQVSLPSINAYLGLLKHHNAGRLSHKVNALWHYQLYKRLYKGVLKNRERWKRLKYIRNGWQDDKK